MIFLTKLVLLRFVLPRSIHDMASFSTANLRYHRIRQHNMGCQQSLPLIQEELPPEQSRQVNWKPAGPGEAVEASLDTQVYPQRVTLVETQWQQSSLTTSFPVPLPRRHPHTVLWHQIGLYFLQRGKLDEAESMVRQALVKNRPDNDKAAMTLVSILEQRQQWSEAEHWMRQILRQRQAQWGSTHVEALKATERLAVLLQAQDKLDQAEVLFRFILIHQKEANLTSCYQLALLLTNKESGYSEAEVWWRKALPQARQIWGPQHAKTLLIMSRLSQLLLEKAPQEAECLCREAMVGQKMELGCDHSDSLDSMNTLARLLQSQKRYSELETLYRQRLEEHCECQGEHHPSTITVREKLAYFYFDQEQWSAAEPLLEQTLYGLCQLHGGTNVARASPSVIICKFKLGYSYLKRTKWDRAAALLRETVIDMEHLWGLRDTQTLQARAAWAVARAHMGQTPEAQAMLQQVNNDEQAHKSWV